MDYFVGVTFSPYIFKSGRQMLICGHQFEKECCSVVILLQISDELKLQKHFEHRVNIRVDQLIMLPCETMFVLCGLDRKKEKTIVLLYRLDVQNEKVSFSEVSQVSIKSCSKARNSKEYIHDNPSICSHFLLLDSQLSLFTTTKHLISIKVTKSRLKVDKDICLFSHFPLFKYVSAHPIPFCHSGSQHLLFATSMMSFQGSQIFEYDPKENQITQKYFLDLSKINTEDQRKLVNFRISLFRVILYESNTEIYVAFVIRNRERGVIYTLAKNDSTSQMGVQNQWSLSDLCNEYASVLDFQCSETTGNCGYYYYYLS